MKKLLLILSFIIFLFAAYRLPKENDLNVPEYWPIPHYDFKKNPLTPAKIKLGRVLFHDPILSSNNTISCTSCHSQYTAFTHVDHALSHGIEGRMGTRNSPALINLAWHKTFMWDGAINHLDMQALAPISHPDEMGSKIEKVLQKLQRSPIYPKLFYEAFGDSNVTGEYTLKALSQFMLTMVSANSKYDSVMSNKAVFTPEEKNGYELFQKNCSSCHTEPLFTNLEFKNNGLPIDTLLKDYGRMNVTKNPLDSLKFKVPTLRNIEFSFPYMHDGRFKKLPDVLNHYTSGIQRSATLAKELQNQVILSPVEKAELLAFLYTLTDKEFLFNSKYSYPKDIFSHKKD
jgi:cytochrome c peroxidase